MEKIAEIIYQAYKEKFFNKYLEPENFDEK